MSTTECNYKEMDRQLKKQFKDGLNDSDRNVEITREWIKIEDNENRTSEQVLAWAKRVEAHMSQSAILQNLKGTKDFDRIFTRNKAQSQDQKQPQEQDRMPTKQKCRYCGYTHPPQWFPTYGKTWRAGRKINHCKEVCRKCKDKRVHGICPQVEQHQDEDDIKKVNINFIYTGSITLKGKCPVITANLTTSSSQATLVVSYKIDSGSNGNKIPFHCYVRQCCMNLKVVQGYRVAYIVAYMGAQQCTMLIFGFPSLCTLRQYVRRRHIYCIQNIYPFIITIYFYYYNTMHRYINTHLSL